MRVETSRHNWAVDVVGKDRTTADTAVYMDTGQLVASCRAAPRPSAAQVGVAPQVR
jgi:hypothetical protein